MTSTAATSKMIFKRHFCTDNCQGSFDANGGGDCENVEMCTNNCRACDAKRTSFTCGGCKCIEKDSCDGYCYNECREGCDNLGNDWQIVGCWDGCAKQCHCPVV